jgi:hypothetical protein
MVGGVDEARRVIERLERIEQLRAAGASRAALLLEVRTLLAEGEAWLAAEPTGTEAARVALERCRAAVAGGREGAVVRAT